MAQANVVNPEASEAYKFLQEAKSQLASVERNFATLTQAIGREMAVEAVAQARASVETYQGAYDLAMGA
jgi:hypothetical protein